MMVETTYYARNHPQAPQSDAVPLSGPRDAEYLSRVEGLHVTAQTEVSRDD